MSYPCEVNPEFWFSENSRDMAHAKEACSHCPARIECAELGEDEEFGIWGGLSPDDRKAAKRFRVVMIEETLNAKVRGMQADGMSISAMARELDIPRKTLADRLRRISGLAA
ncbi:WhiB family transcriptional regulator [Streptomyces sp. NPDC048637]|uniref:WhiB family transcriptional regulator n=1 Tax=Streptomyces sp. NPDC048637 TaxID=3155636 RepID=UPI0034309C9D